MNIGKLLKRRTQVSVAAQPEPSLGEPATFAERISRMAERMANDPNDPINNPKLARRNRESLRRLLDQMAADDPRVSEALASVDVARVE